MTTQVISSGRAEFLEVGPGLGRRFSIYHPPHGPCRGRVLHVHAFAEEMNRSRRMSALQSRALAEAGFAVLQMDLLGCGDSEGEFRDASWNDWLADLQFANRCLAERHDAPLCVWAERAGCLLASELAEGLSETVHLLFWQPLLAGRTQLQQLLRLEQAAQMLGGKDVQSLGDAKARLLAGEGQELGGYELSADLANALERAELRRPPLCRHSAWFEIANSDRTTCSLPLLSAAEAWLAAGTPVTTQVIKAPQYWLSPEIEEAPALVEASTRWLLQCSP